MEEWREVKGYEGLYEVSNYGNVRSVDRFVIQKQKNGKLQTIFLKGKPLSLAGKKERYLFVNLRKDGKSKAKRVHRLVAEAFVENPKGDKEVNHIDENTKNNKAENLEWCTHLENLKYGTRNERISCSLKENPLICREVLQFTTDGMLVNRYANVRVASEITGFSKSAITHGLYHNNGNIAKGYVWKFEK